MTQAPSIAAFRAQAVRLADPLRGPLPLAVRREIAQVMVTDARRRFAAGVDPDGRPWKPLAHKRPTGGTKPLLDRGLLRASVEGVPTAAGAMTFSRLPQASLHEYGGTVKPKRGKYLAIPLTRQAKRAGSPRRMRDLRFRPFGRKGSGGVLFTRRGDLVTDHFLLVRSVTVPARPFLAPSEAALKLIDDIVGRATDARVVLGGR